MRGNEWEVEGMETPGSNFSYCGPQSQIGTSRPGDRKWQMGSGNFWLALVISGLVMLGVWGLASLVDDQVSNPKSQGISNEQVQSSDGTSSLARETRALPARQEPVSFEQIMAVLTAVVFAARVIVKITPTQADDTALAAVMEVLRHLALHIPSQDNGEILINHKDTKGTKEEESQSAKIPTVGPTGRALVCMAIAGGLLSGCAYQHTASLKLSDGRMTETYTGVVWFNKTALKGLEAHKKTANGSSAALSLKEGSTETQPEALKAGSEGLGIILGTALKYAK